MRKIHRSQHELAELDADISLLNYHMPRVMEALEGGQTDMLALARVTGAPLDVVEKILRSKESERLRSEVKHREHQVNFNLLLTKVRPWMEKYPSSGPYTLAQYFGISAPTARKLIQTINEERA